AELMNEPCVRPPDFDLASFWEQSAAQFRAHLPSYRARVRMRPEIIPRMPYAGRFARVEQTGQADEEGWVEVMLRFDVEEMACEYALSFGTQLEVLEPLALREKVLEAAKSVVAFYSQRTTKGTTR
ncbi:MAG: WYL domain-containing protein, partial [Acidobacteria bacterium]|nr:WYL domain-containing protein [Acidobacteriota bacterium]